MFKNRHRRHEASTDSEMTTVKQTVYTEKIRIHSDAGITERMGTHLHLHLHPHTLSNLCSLPIVSLSSVYLYEYFSRNHALFDQVKHCRRGFCAYVCVGGGKRSCVSTYGGGGGVVLLKLWNSLMETSCHLALCSCLWNSGNEIISCAWEKMTAQQKQQETSCVKMCIQ